MLRVECVHGGSELKSLFENALLSHRPPTASANAAAEFRMTGKVAQAIADARDAIGASGGSGNVDMDRLCYSLRSF